MTFFWYLNREDFIALAATLNVKRTTAYTIIRLYQTTGRVETVPTGGGRPQLIDNEQIDLAIMLIEANPLKTLAQLREDIIGVFPNKPPFSVPTLHRYVRIIL